MLDRDGQLLRAFTTSGGKWRLPVTAADVDPHYLRMLVAYEDSGSRKHRGVDLWALGRAAGQLAAHGRIVSGGSTLSMQVARLIEPRKDRSIAAKLIQIARAAQIEKRLSKAEILDLYLNLAPFGGNLEGCARRQASLISAGAETADGGAIRPSRRPAAIAGAPAARPLSRQCRSGPRTGADPARPSPP